MPSLRSLQRSFAASIQGEYDGDIARHVVQDGFTPAERLGIYRNSCRGVMVAALRLTYPAVHRIVGGEFFEEAAKRFVLTCWPSTADLSEYGERFAPFLEGFAPASGLGYLPDVARYEWALSCAAHAEDVAPLNAGALAALAPECHPALRFTPHPSVRLLALRHPADDIADAVLAGDEGAMREVNLGPAPIYLVVHRGPNGVESHRLSAMEHEMLNDLQAGIVWGCLAMKAPAHASALLARELSSGRLAGFRIEP